MIDLPTVERKLTLKEKWLNFYQSEKFIAWMFMLPGLILLTLFVIWPIIYSVPLAFTDYSVISDKKYVGLDNFAYAFKDPNFIKSMINSILYIIIVPVIQIVSILMAVAVNSKIKGVKFFRAAYYIPVITSTVAVSIIWGWLFSSKGSINQLLIFLGVLKEPINWLSNEHTALGTLMFITLWKGLGYYMMIYLAGLQSIPSELKEAAMIDGATKMKVTRYVTIPMLKPQIVLCSLMSLMGAIRVFDEPFVLTKGGPGNATLTSSLYIYQQGFSEFKFGYSAALGLIVSVVVLALSIIVFIYNKKGGESPY